MDHKLNWKIKDNGGGFSRLRDYRCASLSGRIGTNLGPRETDDIRSGGDNTLSEKVMYDTCRFKYGQDRYGSGEFTILVGRVIILQCNRN